MSDSSLPTSIESQRHGTPFVGFWASALLPPWTIIQLLAPRQAESTRTDMDLITEEK